MQLDVTVLRLSSENSEVAVRFGERHAMFQMQSTQTAGAFEVFN